ncbi:hypothetical protein KIY57_01995 [Heyndrickxia coagulans]|nr:hypothetical protein KIY57_01995 [Heyndrickxia coagulans]
MSTTILRSSCSFFAPPGSAFVAVNHIRDMRVGASCLKHVNNDPALKLFFL